ncbi:MAG: MarR family transcriptional regulator [Nannocystaceae bacterium]|nr:MarR family transcriptional regulator [Nannocystaceae bacterium]
MSDDARHGHGPRRGGRTAAAAAIDATDPATTQPRTALAQRRLQAEAYLDLTRIHRVIERRTAELLAEQGLRDVTPAQAGALMVLFQARAPLRARTLAGELGLSEVTVGRFVHALHDAGWVRREPDPADSRAMLLAPTPKAYRALPRFIAVSNALLDEAFAGFSAHEVSRVAQTTERLRRNILGEAREPSR